MAAGFSPDDKNAMTIALSITGSYEGIAGWSNLSSDFDGQGMSLGIMSQSLGAGTLQPLLIAMRDKNRAVLDKIFLPAHLTSLLNMLSKWETQHVGATLAAANAEAAKWARDTLYTSGKFTPACRPSCKRWRRRPSSCRFRSLLP